MTDDLNGIEFVSRDVERLAEKLAGSGAWIGRTMEVRVFGVTTFELG